MYVLFHDQGQRKYSQPLACLMIDLAPDRSGLLRLARVPPQTPRWNLQALWQAPRLWGKWRGLWVLYSTLYS